MKRKNWDIILLVIIGVVLINFIIPAVKKEFAPKTNMPALEEYADITVKHCKAVYSSQSGYPDPNLTAEEKKTLMEYINYGGRDWTEAEYTVQTYGMDWYQAELDPRQIFVIMPALSSDGTLRLYFQNGTEGSDGFKLYSTDVKGNAAQLMLDLLSK